MKEPRLKKDWVDQDIWDAFNTWGYRSALTNLQAYMGLLCDQEDSRGEISRIHDALTDLCVAEGLI